jgi:putative PIN family toxin of toxin-antitoxin system
MPDNLNVVLDTNVLVAAFLSPEGRAAQVVSLAWQGKLRACYNQEILDEYSEVLSRPKFKFKISLRDIQEIVETIKKDGLFFDVQPSNFFLPDETDRVFYDVAKYASAYLITDNIKHYPTEPTIFTPYDFMDTFIDPSDKTNITFAAQVLTRLRDKNI